MTERFKFQVNFEFSHIYKSCLTVMGLGVDFLKPTCDHVLGHIRI